MKDAEQFDRQMRQLRALRILRTWAHVPFLLIFVVAGAVHAADWLWDGVFDAVFANPIFKAFWVLLWGAAISGFFVGFAVSSAKCPRCDDAFHFRTRGNLWFRNEFARKCLNCGLRLDRSNVEGEAGGNAL